MITPSIKTCPSCDIAELRGAARSKLLVHAAPGLRGLPRDLQLELKDYEDDWVWRYRMGSAGCHHVEQYFCQQLTKILQAPSAASLAVHELGCSRLAAL